MNVEIRVVDNVKGKGLFAKRDFKAGEVLFEEDPLVCCQFAWNAHYGYKACDHCMRPLETTEENAKRLTGNYNLTLPYPECCEIDKQLIEECTDCGVQYCSKECKDAAYNQYHRTICYHSRERNFAHPLEKLLQTWKVFHMPPETCSIMLLVRIIATVQQSSNKQEMLQKFLEFCHRTTNENEDIVHKLIGDAFATHIKSLRQFLNKSLSQEGVEPWFTEEGFKSLLALIGTNSQGVGTSAISVWVKNVSELPLPDADKSNLDKFIDDMYAALEIESGAFLNNEGSALYSLQSCCNHSCDPNSQISFLHNNFRLSVEALKDIKAGDEILISYLDDCILDRSRHSRQKYLAENYLFKCNCTKCVMQADEPDVTSEEEMDEND